MLAQMLGMEPEDIVKMGQAVGSFDAKLDKIIELLETIAAGSLIVMPYDPPESNDASE